MTSGLFSIVNNTDIQCLSKVFLPLNCCYAFFVAALINCFKLLFPTSIYTPYTIMVKHTHTILFFLRSLQIKKTEIIPLHKYTYHFLGQFKFSSGAFILLVCVTRLWVKITCGKFNWMGMIWKGTHVLIKGSTADNAYQSKNQALGSKEVSVELRNRVASSHTPGKELRKNILLHWSYSEACSLCYP